MLAIFDKPDPLEGPYFEETLYVTPSRLPAAVLAEVARITAQGCPTWASCSPAGSPGAFEFSLREAHARLRVRIEPSLRPAREAAGVR